MRAVVEGRGHAQQGASFDHAQQGASFDHAQQGASFDRMPLCLGTTSGILRLRCDCAQDERRILLSAVEGSGCLRLGMG